ncbi:MAG: malto-oligosyltrehalose synthase, partial [Chloroflexota bacterium]|nr:malto-oligosyltrehalose synthase [Chloroflexota bacterium]
RGELSLLFEEGAFRIDYWDTPFPISPATYPLILRKIEERLEGELDPDGIELLEFQSIRTALENIDGPVTSSLDSDARDGRQREQTLAKHRLQTLAEGSAVIREAIDDTVVAFNGEPGDPQSFDALDEVLDHQSYRLSSWRVAAEEINYRRFFAINTLAAIRQEEEIVFEDTHRLLFELIAEGAVDGVRIDHPDGLWNPEAYFRSLQRAAMVELTRAAWAGSQSAETADDAWDAVASDVRAAVEASLDRIVEERGVLPLYVVAEKILEHGEALREDWAVAGTVGYEFAQAATELFVDPEARVLFDRIYARFTGDSIRFPELVYEMKHRMMREAFASEVNVLTNALNRISEQDRHSRDFTVNNLRDALREILACFSIYRTYTTCAIGETDALDRRYVEHAVQGAKRRNPTMDVSVFDFIQSVLLSHATQDVVDRLDSRCHFAMKLQQLSGPVMAKGLEDTAFYRFNRLTSLNEVGGDPSKFGTSIEDFHRQNRARRRNWPRSMINSSTHDTKRSEDVRARISVLSEVPTEWRAAINRWSRMNRKLKRKIDGTLAPQRVDEYVLYQALIGTWPLDEPTIEETAAYVERLREYMIKVGREANRLTNWINPDEDYEAALNSFVAGLFDRRRSRAFLEDFAAFHQRVNDGGLINALGQQLLKLTSPGVPDLYQGTELWDDSLVDPDNRRTVDFGKRAALLRADADLPAQWEERRDGAVKLMLTQRVLKFRHAHPDVFATGDYVPLDVIGPRANHVMAFARVHDDAACVIVVPRLAVALGLCQAIDEGTDVWRGTRIALPKDLSVRGFADALDPHAPFVIVEHDDAATFDVASVLC